GPLPTREALHRRDRGRHPGLRRPRPQSHDHRARRGRASFPRPRRQRRDLPSRRLRRLAQPLHRGPARRGSATPRRALRRDLLPLRQIPPTHHPRHFLGTPRPANLAQRLPRSGPDQPSAALRPRAEPQTRLLLRPRSRKMTPPLRPLRRALPFLLLLPFASLTGRSADRVPSPRERIPLDTGWRFQKGDPEGVDTRPLLYDYRP